MSFGQRPHPQFEHQFVGYRDYLCALENDINTNYGFRAARPLAVHDAVLSRPQVHRIQRRPLRAADRDEFDTALRKSWGFLRRVRREVESPAEFDEEATALLPYQAWYAVHHISRAFVIASGQPTPLDHGAMLSMLGATVGRGLLPSPWHLWCGGCPQTGSAHIGGLATGLRPVDSSTPVVGPIEGPLALALRTTRTKSLERVFAEDRRRNIAPGRSRRQVSREEKERRGRNHAPTTIFDFLYRLRTRSSYGEADLFVLGAATELEVWGLAKALAVTCDGTVAALESLIAAYVGPAPVADAANEYADRSGSDLIARRAAAWNARRQ